MQLDCNRDPIYCAQDDVGFGCVGLSIGVFGGNGVVGVVGAASGTPKSTVAPDAL